MNKLRTGCQENLSLSNPYNFVGQTQAVYLRGEIYINVKNCLASNIMERLVMVIFAFFIIYYFLCLQCFLYENLILFFS